MSSSFSQSTVPSKRKAQSGGSLAREKHHLKHQQANAHKPKPPGSTVTDLEKFVWDTLDEHPGHAFASPAACKIADAYKKTHQYRRKEAEWLQRLANKANTPQGWTAPHVQAMEQTLSGYSITKSEIESLVEEQTHQPATEEDAQPAIGDRMDDDAEVPTIPQSGDGGHGNASKEIIFIIDQDLATTEAEFRFTKKIVAKINESLKLHGLHVSMARDVNAPTESIDLARDLPAIGEPVLPTETRQLGWSLHLRATLNDNRLALHGHAALEEHPRAGGSCGAE